MTNSEKDLAKMTSCGMRSVIKAMKKSVTNCKDRKSAENIFKMMFAPNLEKDYGENLYSRLDNIDYMDVFTNLEGNILENVNIWGSKSTPQRFPGSCIPIKDFAYMQMLNTDLFNNPIYPEQYEALMRSYHLKKYNNQNGDYIESDFGVTSGDLSSPFLKMAAHNDEILNEIEDFISHDLTLEFKKLGGKRLFEAVHPSYKFRPKGGNLYSLFQKNADSKKIIIDEFLTSANQSCKLLSDSSHYDEVFCVGRNYIPNTKLLVETVLPSMKNMVADEINLDSESFNYFFSSADLFKRSCSSTRLRIRYNPLTIFLMESNQPISYMDNFKFSSQGSQYIGPKRPHEVKFGDNGKYPLNSVGGKYLHLNESYCSGKSSVESLNERVSQLLKSLPEELHEQIKKIGIPSEGGKIKFGEVDQYLANVFDEIRNKYIEEYLNESSDSWKASN
jgi:hypothetical protein